MEVPLPDAVRPWEAEFIDMWQANVPLDAIAEAHHIRLGTAKSRAHTLQKEGKITPRARGRHMLSRQERPPVPAPPAPQVAPATPAPPALTFVAVPEIQEILSVLKDLQARVVSLEQVRVTPAAPAPPIAPAPPATPAPERRDIVQWTVRLSRALIEDLKALAYERRRHPSEIVEQLLKEALNNRRSE
jgi:hypothetical protein